MKIRKTYNTTIFGILFGISVGFGYQEYYGIGTWHQEPVATESFNVCFTPPKGCASLIAKEIQFAEKTIYIQAYGFTSNSIIEQVKEASKRGVKVRALLDSSNFSNKKSIVSELRSHNVEVIKDKVSGIAHNKVMIIDGNRVITGSFNFTEAADKRNAENVLLIKNKHVAKTYLENWQTRYNLSI